jgi:hypothetical protein
LTKRLAGPPSAGPSRVLAIPDAALRELMLESTAVDRAVRERAFRRLHRAPV